MNPGLPYSNRGLKRRRENTYKAKGKFETERERG